MQLIEMETLPKYFEKLGRKVDICNWDEVDIHWGEESNMLEFHVDDHETLEVFISPFGQKY